MFANFITIVLMLLIYYISKVKNKINFPVKDQQTRICYNSFQDIYIYPFLSRAACRPGDNYPRGVAPRGVQVLIKCLPSSKVEQGTSNTQIQDRNLG
jgi:hypothetical protein